MANLMLPANFVGKQDAKCSYRNEYWYCESNCACNGMFHLFWQQSVFRIH